MELRVLASFEDNLYENIIIKFFRKRLFDSLSLEDLVISDFVV